MKEKTYYEVLEEMEGRVYDKLDIQLEIGEKCLRDIEALQNTKDAKSVHRIVEIKDKQYEISISEWEPIWIKELSDGIREV